MSVSVNYMLGKKNVRNDENDENNTKRSKTDTYTYTNMHSSVKKRVFERDLDSKTMEGKLDYFADYLGKKHCRYDSSLKIFTIILKYYNDDFITNKYNEFKELCDRQKYRSKVSVSDKNNLYDILNYMHWLLHNNDVNNEHKLRKECIEKSTKKIQCINNVTCAFIAIEKIEKTLHYLKNIKYCRMDFLNCMIVDIYNNFEYPDLLDYFKFLINEIIKDYVMINKRFIIKISKKYKFINAFEDIYKKYKLRQTENSFINPFEDNYEKYKLTQKENQQYSNNYSDNFELLSDFEYDISDESLENCIDSDCNNNDDDILELIDNYLESKNNNNYNINNKPIKICITNSNNNNYDILELIDNYLESENDNNYDDDEDCNSLNGL